MRRSTRKLPLAIALLLIASVSAACGRPAPRAEEDSPRSSAAVERPAPLPLEHIELLTGGAAPGEELPMIVAIHGLGDRPASFAGLFDGLPARARVVLPRAPKTWRPGYSWFDIAIPYSGNEAALEAGIGAAADLLARFIAEISEREPTRGKPVVTGFSQGGMLSFAVAVRHPDLISLAAPMGGALPEGMIPKEAGARPFPRIRAFNGEADALVPIGYARKTVGLLKEAGADAILTEYPGVGHSVSPRMRARVFDLVGEAVR